MNSTQRTRLSSESSHTDNSMKHPYRHFALMLLTSVFIMFVIGYLNVYQFDHVLFSQSRLYMAILMGSGMAIVMLGFMRNMMLKDSKTNLFTVAAAGLIFIGALFLLRSQTIVDDVAYMEAMIPHHSIAIMTSNRAQISDPRVRKLADKIINTQQKEIAEMKALIRELER